MGKFFKFLKGYVEIEVKGFAINRFLNLCTTKNIKLWDIQFLDSKILCSIKIRDFYTLKGIGKKSGCDVKIKGKKGIPFISFRYRKRRILKYGIVFFIFTIYFLSSFVWYIDISGNEHINNYEIIDILKANNAKVGGLKNKVDSVNLEKAIQKSFPSVAWISIFQEGTTLFVQISESIEQTANIKEDIPSNLYAKKDGVIVYTKTSKGKQVVTIGDVVKEGDLLVTGEIFLKEDEEGKHYNYIKAISEIRANTTYDFKYNLEKNKIIETPTGERKNNFKLYFFGKTIDGFKSKVNYDYYKKNTQRYQLKLSEKYILPIVIIKEVYEELDVKTKLKTDEELKEESEILLNNIINSKFDSDVDIISKEINIKKTSQNIVVYSIIGVNENISIEKPIEVKNIEDNIEDNINN
ncbi:MAG: sporulation protein YqfD [Lachnospirales bacterium]